MGTGFSTKDEGEVLKLLHNVPIFFDLDSEALKSITTISTQATFEPGKKIIQEGGYGDSLHLILVGKVEVRKNGKMIATLGIGQFFGEMAFLDDLSRKRSADVVAIEETKCLVILVKYRFEPLLSPCSAYDTFFMRVCAKLSLHAHVWNALFGSFPSAPQRPALVL